jgi:hypothetical protein
MCRHEGGRVGARAGTAKNNGSAGSSRDHAFLAFFDLLLWKPAAAASLEPANVLLGKSALFFSMRETTATLCLPQILLINFKQILSITIFSL